MYSEFILLMRNNISFFIHSKHEYIRDLYILYVYTRNSSSVKIFTKTEGACLTTGNKVIASIGCFSVRYTWSWLYDLVDHDVAIRFTLKLTFFPLHMLLPTII